MDPSCLDAVIESLSSLHKKQCLPYTQTQQLRVFEVDLRFNKMFLRCSVSWDFNADLRFILASIERIWQHDGVSRDLNKLLSKDLPSTREIKKVFNRLRNRILQSKKEIRKCCEYAISKSWKCIPLPSHEIQQFLDAIIFDMEHLITVEILPMENQIMAIKEKLLIFWKLVEFTAMICVDCKALKYFNIHVLTWSIKAASLTFLYREAIDGSAENESETEKISLMVTDLVQKVNPCTSEFIDECLGLIKLTKSSHAIIVLFEEFAPSFVDFLLQNLTFTSRDDFWLLREGLIYMTTFLAGLPLNDADNPALICLKSQIDTVLMEASHLICLFGEDRVAFRSERSVHLAKLMEMIDQVKEKIDKHYLHLSRSSWSYFPRTNGLGFFDSLLVYLTDLEETMSGHPKLVPSFKHQIFEIKNGLTSLMPFLQDISELQNENKELKNLWEEIISVAYQAELVINQSFFIDLPLCLSYVLRKVQAIHSKVMRVKGSEIFTTGVISSLTSSANMLTVSTSTSWADEDMVGFKQDIEVLTDRLIGGTTRLDIVSITGMGGIGKTTLAKKLYNKESVRCYFHKRAFCTISQVYSRRNILLDILNQVNGNDVDVKNMTEEDLVLCLYQSLKGYKYLIVLDDIWGMSAWNDVQDSFPNDNNKSRIMFTTRIYDVASLAKPNCTSHELQFLTIGESWELLQRKIFHNNACPPFLCTVGRSIAKNCKGLPLAVVVIAGLLAKSERSLSWWQKIANKLKFYVSNEGCLDIIEVSYQHLSEASKACFLYLGAFPEDYHYTSGRITKLWAAERFVVKSDRSCMGKLGKEYLNYLGERSLLVVTERSVAGNIKCFRLHDVIREFCIRKAQEENFLWLVNGDDDNFSTPLIYDQYRVCVQGECRSFLDANPRGPAVHSLLQFHHGDKEYESITSSLFRNVRLLQLLEIQNVQFPDFPTRITMLVHLRYLALKCHCKNVPPTIANLQNLETLHLSARVVVDLPDTIWKLKRLKHMEFLGGCRFNGLNDAEGDAFPQLPDLESLNWVHIKDKTEGEQLLRRLPNVRRLSCEFQKFPEELFNLTKLESLFIKWRGAYGSLLSLPLTLRRLVLRYINLSSSELSAMIGELPCLQVVKLQRCIFQDKRWDMEDDEFPGLKCLELTGSGIDYWNATTDSFPCLEKLVLEYCDRLVEIPPCFGEVPTLKVLEVKSCSKGVKKSAYQIQNDQFETGNESLKCVILPPFTVNLPWPFSTLFAVPQ